MSGEGKRSDWPSLKPPRPSSTLLARSFVCECHTISAVPRFQPPPRRTQHADLSGSSAIAGFRPHRSHRAALPQWALQKGPEAGRSSGHFVHTREVRLQGLPALCLALRLPRRDPFLPLPFLHRLVSFGDFIDSMERSDSHPRCGELWLSLVRRPHRRPPVDADGSHRFRNAPFGRDVVQAPGGASGLSHDETRCAVFAGAGASSASATCRFRESIPHPVQPLSTLRTPRCRDARKTRSRPACSALNGPDFHWQAHSSFPLAPRTALSSRWFSSSGLSLLPPSCVEGEQ